MYRTLSAAAAVVITALMFVPPAMAQDNTITVSAAAPTSSGLYQTKAVNVSLAGIDINSAQGAAAMLDRIDSAARLVCGERAGFTMNGARAKVFASCRAQTMAYAVKAVNAPQLTQLAAVR